MSTSKNSQKKKQNYWGLKFESTVGSHGKVDHIFIGIKIGQGTTWDRKVGPTIYLYIFSKISVENRHSVVSIRARFNVHRDSGTIYRL